MKLDATTRIGGSKSCLLCVQMNVFQLVFSVSVDVHEVTKVLNDRVDGAQTIMKDLKV